MPHIKLQILYYFNIEVFYKKIALKQNNIFLKNNLLYLITVLYLQLIKIIIFHLYL